MGRNCNAVLGKVPSTAITLPGLLQGSPFHLEVLQVWNAYNGKTSQNKGWLSTKVGAMSLRSGHSTTHVQWGMSLEWRP
eukprot:2426796-Prorocentrum_lima.AAC.1